MQSVIQLTCCSIDGSMLEITDGLREMILTGASSLELKSKASEEGMITLRGSGLRKLKAGQTTVEEVIRETVL